MKPWLIIAWHKYHIVSSSIYIEAMSIVDHRCYPGHFGLRYFINQRRIGMIFHALKTRKRVLPVVLPATIIIMWTTSATAFDKVNQSFFGVAIKGYDAVAYHIEDRAVKGSSEFSYTWNDSKWYFTSAGNRDLFAADPQRYAPQYGGYWARSLSTTGKAAGVNPKAFKIIDGKLYLNWDKESADIFESGAAENIKKADASWEKITQKH